MTGQDPLGFVDDDKFTAEYMRWEQEHLIRIRASESNGGVDTTVLVWDRYFGGEVRLDIKNSKRTDSGRAHAYLTPSQARRLSDLLLEAATAAGNYD